MNDVAHPKYERLQAYKNTFASIEDWNEFVGKLGLIELQNITEELWLYLLENNEYKTFNSLHKQDQAKIDVLDFYWNVIPTGAGSSFIGALQSYLLFNYEVPDPNKRKNNLWDDEYGTRMTMNYPQVENKIIKGNSDYQDKIVSSERIFQRLFNGYETWYTLFEQYYSTLTSTMTHNAQNFRGAEKVFVEFTVHNYLLLFELFGNSKINLFMDCTWERFKWCYLLAFFKHEEKGINPEYKVSATRRAWYCKRAWEIYKITKQYHKPLITIDYELLFIHQDEDTIKKLIYETLQRDPTDRQIEYLGKHLNMYTNRNNKIMETIPTKLWDKFTK